ncbi:MAG: helix-turn-helix transcriptional regulator [Parachlamydiaceae bacterium]|nr:helix-turn-helix transcriptional regulator [Parachlamydiaceae bacterium]
MHLALQVRNRRYMLSLTQEQLAEKINCHVNYLGGIERAERNLSLILLIALAKGLECTLKDLLPQY